MHLGRTIGVIVAVLLVVGAAVYVFFRFSFSAEGLYRVQTAVGLDAPRPERHIVPEGFHGWAVMRYNAEGAEPLRDDDGVLVVEYGGAGVVETSTPAHDEQGFFNREYFERTADGLRPLRRTGEIWGEYNMRVVSDDRGAVTERISGFFVGTMAEFRASERPRPVPDLPEIPPRFGAPADDREPGSRENARTPPPGSTREEPGGEGG